MQLHDLIFQAELIKFLVAEHLSVGKAELKAECSMEKEEGHDATSQYPMNIA